MKATLRMKHALLQRFIFLIFFCFFFLGVFFYYFYPKIQVFQASKAEYDQLKTTLLRIENQGINYEEFQNYISQNADSSSMYTTLLLEKINAEFYDKNFSNTGSENYAQFLVKLQNRVSEQLNSPQYKEQKSIIESIIPAYGKDTKMQDGVMNDFYFVNYIENLLFSFRLQSKGAIGVGSIQKVENNNEILLEQEVSSDEKESLLEENIYAIPLNFEITGRKADIIDFIYYFQNVGALQYTNDELKVYSDTQLSQEIILPLEKQSNIYKNQFAEITRISLEKYPDSSSVSQAGTSLLDKIKNSQYSEKMSVVLEISFYVSGIPGYKFNQYISNFFTQYDTLYQDILQSTGKYLSIKNTLPGNQKLAFEKIASLEAIIKNLKPQVEAFRKVYNAGGEVDYQAQFEQVSILASKIEVMRKIYSENIELLTQK